MPRCNTPVKTYLVLVAILSGMVTPALARNKGDGGAAAAAVLGAFAPPVVVVQQVPNWPSHVVYGTLQSVDPTCSSVWLRMGVESDSI
jgi:hypothetical protein